MEMVTAMDCSSQVGCKPTNSTSRPAEEVTPVRHRKADRKQRLTSRFCDSGFEEDLLISSPTPAVLSPLRSDGAGDGDDDDAGQLSDWYLQYGDIGYQIQRRKEAQFHPCKSLARQPQLTTEARCKLVSWLIPVNKHLHLSFECCCLAVNIMDRFLASTPVAADCFQLLGVTALLLATKKVEVCSPRISHLLSLCCDAFTKDQLCNLECLILVRLNFCLGAPTLAFFLDYYTKCIEAAHFGTGNMGAQRAARHCSSLAQKVCELSLADYAFNKYPPSLTASCALRLASDLLRSQQVLVEEKVTTQSQDDQWDRFVDLFESNHMLADTEGFEFSEGNILPVIQQRCNHNLEEECKDNLKLLVSLNRESLEALCNF